MKILTKTLKISFKRPSTWFCRWRTQVQKHCQELTKTERHMIWMNRPTSAWLRINPATIRLALCQATNESLRRRTPSCILFSKVSTNLRNTRILVHTAQRGSRSQVTWCHPRVERESIQEQTVNNYTAANSTDTQNQQHRICLLIPQGTKFQSTTRSLTTAVKYLQTDNQWLSRQINQSQDSINRIESLIKLPLAHRLIATRDRDHIHKSRILNNSILSKSMNPKTISSSVLQENRKHLNSMTFQWVIQTPIPRMNLLQLMFR